jgi:phosphatidylserine decarboxylase
MASNVTFLHIAREGWPPIALTAAAGAAAYTLGVWWAALPFVAVVAGLAFFFHDGDRHAPAEPFAVVTPVDGRVVRRRECHDPFLDRDAVRISVRVARFGQYFLRAPVEGTVLELTPDVWPEFTGTASWIRTDEGDDLVIAVSEGVMFGARPCQTPYGERVGQGRRCGARRLARCLDLYLPVNTRFEADIGQRVAAGCSTLATLMHKKNGNGNGHGNAAA